MAHLSYLEKCLNTVQLCFARHHSHEVSKAVFDIDAKEGVHDFELVSEVLWELMPEVMLTGELPYSTSGRTVVDKTVSTPAAPHVPSNELCDA